MNNSCTKLFHGVLCGTFTIANSISYKIVFLPQRFKNAGKILKTRANQLNSKPEQATKNFPAQNLREAFRASLH